MFLTAMAASASTDANISINSAASEAKFERAELRRTA
jgi:hypothetical protein